MSHTGTLQTFKRARGFGFIERDDGQGELFCHVAHLRDGGLDDMIVGSKMNFDILVDEHRGTTCAQNIIITVRGAIKEGSHSGTLQAFKVKGFGFIERDDGQGEVFCHVSQLQNGGREDMIVGSRMTFDIAVDEQSGNKIAENIRITERAKGGSHCGVLRKFKEGKGFGFIERDDGQDDLFCHFAQLVNGGHDDMIVGSKMTFDIVEDEQFGTLRAHNIMITKRASFFDNNSCKACNVPCDPPSDASARPRRGGDGWWYCHSCWPKWWEEDAGAADSSSLCCVFPRWCPPSQDPVNINFPLKSVLPLDGFGCSRGVAADVQNLADVVRIFFENGFVVIRNALSSAAVEDVLHACRSVHNAVRDIDKECMGNRSRGRYSFGSVVRPGQCFHLEAFSKHLVNNTAILDVFDAIYAEADRRRFSKAGAVSADADATTGMVSDTPATLSPEADTSHENPYYIVGTGGDFCEGWVREFQQLHSDYGRGRPLRGPPWGMKGEPPVHDKEYPPQISVNFAVQRLHRWNGATRVIPWPEMESYVDEYGEYGSYKSGQSTMKGDTEVPPSLAHEFKLKRHWLASRIFPLEAGDALLRDVRVWHGGCPNLSREPRYLPSLEVASRDTVAHFVNYIEPFPRRVLPVAYAQSMSERCRRRCAKVIMDEQCDKLGINNNLNDFKWLKSIIFEPARRNEFLFASSMTPTQSDAISLRACLDLLTQRYSEKNFGLCNEQTQWLMTSLAKLHHCNSTGDESSSSIGGEKDIDMHNERSTTCQDVNDIASALSEALAKGPLRKCFTENARFDGVGMPELEAEQNQKDRENQEVNIAQMGNCKENMYFNDNRNEIAQLARRLLTHLRHAEGKRPCQDESVRLVKQRVH